MVRLLAYFFLIFFISNLSSAIEFKGKFEQGSLIIGKTRPSSLIFIDKKKMKISKEGFFVFGISRNHTEDILIRIKTNKGFEEINKKVEISIGLIIFIIAATYSVTTFYNRQNTLESRMDKRHKRTEERIDQIEKNINELFKVQNNTEENGKINK